LEQGCVGELGALPVYFDLLDEDFGLALVDVLLGKQRLCLWDFEVETGLPALPLLADQLVVLRLFESLNWSQLHRQLLHLFIPRATHHRLPKSKEY
jgi:hypothetical protein